MKWILAIGGVIVLAGVVMLVSILLARFLDNGAIFTTQMGLQSVLVVLLLLLVVLVVVAL